MALSVYVRGKGPNGGLCLGYGDVDGDVMEGSLGSKTISVHYAQSQYGVR